MFGPCTAFSLIRLCTWMQASKINLHSYWRCSLNRFVPNHSYFQPWQRRWNVLVETSTPPCSLFAMCRTVVPPAFLFLFSTPSRGCCHFWIHFWVHFGSFFDSFFVIFFVPFRRSKIHFWYFFWYILGFILVIQTHPYIMKIVVNVKKWFQETACCMSWGRLGVVSAPLCGPDKQVKKR